MSMEVQRMQICLILGILLVFSVSEGKKFCVEKYISKSYFEKKESLDDAEFDDFVKDEISSCYCRKDNINIEPRLSSLHRSLIGEGSHRRLSSTIRLESEISERPCEAIIIEKLPSGVFADPFELQHLVQRKVLSDAAVFGDTNLELPSFRSNRSLVEIHTGISSPASLSGKSTRPEINVQLPLHARYQPLGERYVQVNFGLPDILLRCSVEGESLQRQSCVVMMPTGQITKFDAVPSVVWEVPCGNKEHAGMVSLVTFVSAIVSASVIVLTSIRHSYLTTSQV